MKLRVIKKIAELKGRRVLLRLDLNAPLTKGHLEQSDLWKLRSSLGTLETLIEHGARIIIIAHFGRPDGKKDPKLSLRPVIKKFSQMIGQKIEIWDDSLISCQKKSLKLTDGQVVCLENIRFHKGEQTCNSKFSKQLAALGDVFINDAFGDVGGKYASNVGVTKYLPSYAGRLMDYEVQHLSQLFKKAKRPIVAIMGGSKISTKIILIRQLLEKVNFVLLGGALANNVLRAQKIEVGRSLVDNKVLRLDNYILSNKLKLPVDARVSTSYKAKARLTAIGNVGKNELILDLGPDTVNLYGNIITKAKTIIWNGPLGYFEDPRYAVSTTETARKIATARAREYVGGGETVKAILKNRLEDKMFFVSSGGGAMLALLEGKKLPALEVLKI